MTADDINPRVPQDGDGDSAHEFTEQSRGMGGSNEPGGEGETQGPQRSGAAEEPWQSKTAGSDSRPSHDVPGTGQGADRPMGGTDPNAHSPYQAPTYGWQQGNTGQAGGHPASGYQGQYNQAAGQPGYPGYQGQNAQPGHAGPQGYPEQPPQQGQQPQGTYQGQYGQAAGQPGYSGYQGQQGYPGQGQGGQQWQGQQTQGAGASAGTGYQFSGMSPQDARTWAIVAHVCAPVLYLLTVGWAGLLAPLVMWLIFKDKDPLVRQASAGAFNFNFLLMLVSVGAWLLGFITLGLLVPLSLLVVSVLFILQVVFAVLGAMEANRGRAYNYPFGINILK